MEYMVYAHEVTGVSEDGEVLARVTFPFVEEQVVEINHTLVDERLRGQGAANILLEKAAGKIRQEGWKARLSCSYAQKWFARHPEHKDLLVNSFVLSCCSTADLTREHFTERDISFICFHYQLDGKSYSDDLGQSIPFDQFYQRMTEGASTATSQINPEEYAAYFEGFLKEGRDVLHLCLSSGITSTMNSACIARDMLAEQYPERKILVLDSLAASSGYGLLMDKLADLRDQGQSIDQVYQWAEKHRLDVHHWFFTSDLTFFIRGGRISKTAGFIGGVLNICPLLNVDCQGRLIPRQKIRTKKKVIQAIVDKMEECAQDGLQYSGKCYISHSACRQDAQAVAALVEARFPHLDGQVEIYDIGTTIGSHTGPGTVALFFWGKPRND